MAVETTNALSGPFLPNGATVSFPFTFTAPSADEVEVMLRAADGTETMAVGYTVNLNPAGGGSVVFDVAPAAGPQLFVLLEPRFTQQVQFENGSGWLAEPVNEVADRSAARDQVLRRDIGRSLRMPLGEDPGQLPSKAQLANKFIGGDAMGEILALSGTGNDPDFREDAADPAVGPRLWGYRLPITEALARHAQGKFDERISTFDFLPYGKHSQILDRTNNDDLSEMLNDGIFNNPECRGARIFCPPGLYNHEQTLTCMQHMTLYGAAGREMMDNSADAGGDTGTRFRFRGNSGHAMALTVPDLDNHRTIVRLQDILIQHNRLLDADPILGEQENPDQDDGCALYIAGGLGPTQGDRQLRFILDNVGLYGGIDDNLLIEGNTYGSEIRYIHSMRAGRNGIRSLYGPSAGESRIAMARIFQCGWNGTDDLSRANAAISAALIDIGQFSSSESRGPNLMIGGIANINSLQSESGGLDVTAADRKQVVLGWLENGLLSLNVNNMLLDPGDAYQGAVVYHSRHSSNVRLKGHFANALGVGGRHVELQAPDGPYSCGEIDVRETNASVFLDNSSGYNVKSGIEVRLRHGAHVALTGDNELVNFRPDELYDPKGCWDAATWRFTAPHNLILDPEMVMAMTGVDKANHDRLWVHVQLNGADYRIIPDDPSSHVLAGSSLATFPVAMPTIPMDQGDYVEFKYKSYGGPPTVGLVASQSYLKLTALPR